MTDVDAGVQVYVLAIVGAMHRSAEMDLQRDLTILVPPYDPAEIFSPSYGHDEPNPGFPAPG